MMLFNNLGLDIYGLREVSRGADASYVLSNILAIKSVLYLAVSGISVFFLLLFADKLVMTLLFILLGSLALNDLAPQWYFQAKERFGVIAFAKVLHSFAYLAIVLLFVHSVDDIYFLAFIHLVGFGVLFVVMFARYRDSIDLSYIDISRWREMLSVSIVLASSLFMTEIYTSMDKLMIPIWYSSSYIGYYDVAFKLYSILLIGFGIIWTVFAPKVAKKDIFSIKIFASLILGCGLVYSFILFFFGDSVLLYLFGDEYMYASSTVSMFGLIGVAVSFGFVLSAPLSMWGYEKLWFRVVFISAVVNVLLNIVLIPFFDIRGAMIATLIAELLVVLVILSRIKPIYHKVFNGA
jgi:O-antigen/teichoic acid export membrane protein